MRRFALALFALLVAPRLAQGQPAEDPPPPQSQPEPAPSEASPPGGGPPPHYYVEPAEPGAARPASPAPAQAPQGVHEPPPPGYGYAPALVYEPPPPPKPRHLAPKYSFWLGARLGWFVPFGNVWARGTPRSDGLVQLEGVSWSDYASSGPMVEVDVGARLGRNYNLFLLWEHAALGRGSALTDAFGGQQMGDSDFVGIGLRVSSDPDQVGFLTEIDLGARRFRAVWADGRELQLAQAPFEARLGLGADIRLGRAFSLSPMLTLGIGAFGSAEWVNPDGSIQDATGDLDESTGHGWFTLQVGGHFDIGGGG